MKVFKTILHILLVIFFPLGIIYAIIHTIAKDFTSFIGGICLVGVGVLIGIYLIKPDLIMNWLQWLLSIPQMFRN